MSNPKDNKRLSLSSVSSSMEINTSTIINEHNGDTFVGSNVSNSNENHLKLHEEIQINIQSDSSVIIESNNKVPQVIINHYGPSVQLSKEIVAKLKCDGEWDNFLERLFDLSVRLKNEHLKEIHGQKTSNKENNEIITISRDVPKKGGNLTISINKVNYSLKNANRKNSCWGLWVSEDYLPFMRGSFTVLMLFATLGSIYGITMLVLNKSSI